MNHAFFCRLALAVLLCSSFYGTTCAASLPLTTVAEEPLPGNATRWDYASLDERRGILYLAHLGDDTVVAYDVRRHALVGTIPGISKVHGVLFVPELNRIYATATDSNQLVSIDAITLKIRQRTTVGHHPDGMAFEPQSKKIYVSNEWGNSVSVVDSIHERLLKEIPLGGEVGNTQYDARSGHLFSNVQTIGILAEIDPATDEVVRRLPLPGAQGNHGLLIDPVRRQAYIACDGNDRLLLVDLKQGKVLGQYPLGRDPDVLALDSAKGWLYVASESGQLALFNVQKRHLEAIALKILAPNAHVVAVDDQTHRAYFPLQGVNGKPQLLILQPTHQTPSVDGR